MMGSMMGSQNIFRVKRIQTVPVQIWELSGSLDFYHLPRFETQIADAENNQQYHLVLNLRDATYIGSATFGFLIGIARRFRENDGDIVLCQVPERLWKIIQLLGFEKHLLTFGTTDEAVKYFLQKWPKLATS